MSVEFLERMIDISVEHMYAQKLARKVTSIPGWKWLPTMVNAHGKNSRAAYRTDNDGEPWVVFIRPDGGCWQDPENEGEPDITDMATGIQMARLAGVIEHVSRDDDGKWSISVFGVRSPGRQTIGEAVAVFVLACGSW